MFCSRNRTLQINYVDVDENEFDHNIVKVNNHASVLLLIMNVVITLSK